MTDIEQLAAELRGRLTLVDMTQYALLRKIVQMTDSPAHFIRDVMVDVELSIERLTGHVEPEDRPAIDVLREAWTLQSERMMQLVLLHSPGSES